MNKSKYQMLRFQVEGILRDGITDGASPDINHLTNLCMRALLDAVAQDVSSHARAKRQFVTFRRNPDAIAPGWAFRNPGNVSRLPTV